MYGQPNFWRGMCACSGMLQIRFHGRGGQGVVSAAEMLAIAAFTEGKYAQAFPSFGSERMGAPVTSYCRIDDKPIRLREPILNPDIVVVQDQTLLHERNLLEGLVETGYVLLNLSHPWEHAPDSASKLDRSHVCSVPATEIALRHLGKPLPNTVLLGGLAALTGAVRLESLCCAIRSKFTAELAQRNIAAASEAFAFVTRAAPHILESVPC